MKNVVFENLTQIEKSLVRPSKDIAELFDTISTVFNRIKKEGDTALFDYTLQFDGVRLDASTIKITAEEIKEAITQVDPNLKDAILLAAKNIEKFHQAQEVKDLKVETMPGVICERKASPIEKVGLYIPGGSAPLFSTVLMLALPAKIAGCKKIVLCTPPNKEGKIHPAILFTAQLCGVKNIYKAGGSQAIAAMTLGTESIPKVYKIFGPGNQFVTAAKQYATVLGTAIDMPAGPSEVMIVADKTADADFIAADLLSQAEHGPDSQVVLVSCLDSILEQTQKAISRQLNELPRKEIAAKALENSVYVKVANKEEALVVVNSYAPEHLILSMDDADYFVDNVLNAGSVFIGNYTPESAGDYASGTNHTLPTNGYALQYSGVSLQSFQKNITYQKISPEGLRKLGPAIEIMAENEELFAHKNAVSLRLNKLNQLMP